MQGNNVGATAIPASTGNGFSTSASLAYNPSNNATLNFLQAQQVAVAAAQQQQQQQQQQLVLNQAQINAVNFLQQQQQFLQQQQQQQQTQHNAQPSPPQSQQQTMSPKDTTFTKIFVGGLPYHTTDESLRAFFSKYGNIEEAVVITDRTTGKSRGYGFVTMETKEAAEAAVYDPNPIIDGRRSNVNLAYLGVKSRLVQPATGFIPLTIARCPIPATAATTAYGFHPFYYQPMSASTVPQTIQIAPPNLLLPSTSLINGTGGATSTTGASTSTPTLIDLSSAYSAQMQAAAVANALGSSGSRASPFVDTSAQSFLSLGGNPAVLNSILAGNVAAQSSNGAVNSNSLSAQQQQQSAATNGTTGATTTATGYFTLPQHLAATFQSQLQDRINI